jgi:hypothetical protein
MELDSLREAWQRQRVGAMANQPDREIMKSIQQRLVHLHQIIGRRDRREIGAAIFGALIFGYLFVIVNRGLSRIGAGIIIAGSVLIIVKLKLARKQQHDPQAQLNLTEFFLSERERIQAQIRLLRSVPLWYLGPILLGANLFFAGRRNFFPEGLGFFVISLLLAAFVYWLNLQAVRHQLLPIKRELDSLIGELELNGDEAIHIQER